MIITNIFNGMFVRLLAVLCDQNNSYEITINGYQARKINEIRNVIFGLQHDMTWGLISGRRLNREWGSKSRTYGIEITLADAWADFKIDNSLSQPCNYYYKKWDFFDIFQKLPIKRFCFFA